MSRVHAFFLFILYRLVLRPILRIIVGIRVQSDGEFAWPEQFILVSNHNSHLDTLSILSLLPLELIGKVQPVAAADYFGQSFFARFISKNFLNSLLIYRQKTPGAPSAMGVMGEALVAKKSLIIFPEGSRGSPEVLQEFKMGASLLSKRYPEIPIIPVFMEGLGKALPKGDPFLVPHDCVIHLGKPQFLTNPNLEAEEVTQWIRNSILSLQPQKAERQKRETYRNSEVS